MRKIAKNGREPGRAALVIAGLVLALIATFDGAATASAATTVAPSTGPVAPLTFQYIRGFYYYDECNSYGYYHYGGYNNNWFCVRDYNPNDLPWALWAQEID